MISITAWSDFEDLQELNVNQSIDTNLVQECTAKDFFQGLKLK